MVSQKVQCLPASSDDGQHCQEERRSQEQQQRRLAVHESHVLEHCVQDLTDFGYLAHDEKAGGNLQEADVPLVGVLILRIGILKVQLALLLLLFGLVL